MSMIQLGSLGHGRMGNNLGTLSAFAFGSPPTFSWRAATLPPGIMPGHSLPTLGRAFPLLICLVPTPNLLLQRLNRGNGPSDLGGIWGFAALTYQWCGIIRARNNEPIDVNT
jgi:hypothetical protein